MITAVDTNVLLDVFGADREFGPRSAEALHACRRKGRLVACEVVWAETASFFPSPAAARGPMERLEVGFSPLDVEAALAASGAWRKHRATGGRRDRVAADFLIGAHAKLHAERLLTRDRSFYLPCFSGLGVLDPAATPDAAAEERR